MGKNSSGRSLPLAASALTTLKQMRRLVASLWLPWTELFLQCEASRKSACSAPFYQVVLVVDTNFIVSLFQEVSSFSHVSA